MAEDSFQVQAKGSRPDEALEANVKLPLLEAAAGSSIPHPAASAEAPAGPFGIKLGDLIPRSGPEAQVPSATDGGGRFSLRCGQLLMSAEVLLSAAVSVHPMELVQSCSGMGLKGQAECCRSMERPV